MNRRLTGIASKPNQMTKFYKRIYDTEGSKCPLIEPHVERGTVDKCGMLPNN